jgi:hypothetical protein
LKRAAPAVLVVLLLLAALPARAEDALERLGSDPSPAATKRLGALYDKAPGRYERFWVVQALGARLRERKDPLALEALLRAARDREADVRRQALRELTAFGALPAAASAGPLRARVEEAARRGLKDRSAAVRQGAEELRAVLDGKKDPRAAAAPPPDAPPPAPRRLLRLLRILWWLSWPLLAGVWALRGFPVFSTDPEGERARRAWRELARSPGLTAFTALLWTLLAVLAAGYGLDLLARLCGRPLYRAAWSPFAAYFAGGFCTLAPGVLFAVQRGRGASLAWGLLRAAALSAAVFTVLLPAEVLYRLLFRNRRPQHGLFGGLLEAGVLRASYAASAAMREGAGLLPAFALAAKTARELPAPLGLGAFHPRFQRLCSGPAVFGLCVLTASALPVEWSAGALRVGLGLLLWGLLVHFVLLFAVLQPVEGALSRARGGEEEVG